MAQSLASRAVSTLLAVSWLLAVETGGAAGGLESPLNGRVLDLDRSAGAYSFVTLGHTYGSQNGSIFPAASLLAGIDEIRSRKPRFMVLMGDIVRRPEAVHFRALQEGLLNRLPFPVFNTPGNHDVSAGHDPYERVFGRTFQDFTVGSALFVLLDSERDQGRITGAQYRVLEEAVDRFEHDEKVNILFIFSHRLIWTVGNPPYDELGKYANARNFQPGVTTRLSREILPRLRLITGKQAFFLAGDVGVTWSLPLFFEKEAGSRITYIAVGSGDTAGDLFLQADVKEGRVTFTPVSLTYQTLAPISHYGLAYWRAHLAPKKGASPPQKRRKEPVQRILQVVSHIYFQAGFSLAWLIILTLWWAQKWRRDRP